jgi:thiamine-phosphate pyrophosphorylase
MNAAEAGADYVSFGAFFPSKTKQSKGKPTPEILEWWSTYTNVPCVAIGGINAGNCGELSRSGADFLAIISAIWEHPFGPSAAIKEINAALQSTIAKSLADC